MKLTMVRVPGGGTRFQLWILPGAHGAEALSCVAELSWRVPDLRPSCAESSRTSHCTCRSSASAAHSADSSYRPSAYCPYRPTGTTSTATCASTAAAASCLPR
uniref:(northern house mosquito) hypothetical protein n=1 Tax=Culex pipiens TaxID=7175 RepID=A0A8D8C7S8_CULPI